MFTESEEGSDPSPALSISTQDFCARLKERAVRGPRSQRSRPTGMWNLGARILRAGSFLKGPGESLMADSLVQNIPFGLARGMFGAINGAELFGSPTTCKESQCSIALPSASIL